VLRSVPWSQNLQEWWVIPDRDLILRAWSVRDHVGVQLRVSNFNFLWYLYAIRTSIAEALMTFFLCSMQFLRRNETTNHFSLYEKISKDIFLKILIFVNDEFN